MNKGIAKIPPQQTTQHIYRPLPSLQSNNVHRTSEISVVSMIGFHYIIIPKLERSLEKTNCSRKTYFLQMQPKTGRLIQTISILSTEDTNTVVFPQFHIYSFWLPAHNLVYIKSQNDRQQNSNNKEIGKETDGDDVVKQKGEGVLHRQRGRKRK